MKNSRIFVYVLIAIQCFSCNQSDEKEKINKYYLSLKDKPIGVFHNWHIEPRDEGIASKEGLTFFYYYYVNLDSCLLDSNKKSDMHKVITFTVLKYENDSLVPQYKFHNKDTLYSKYARANNIPLDEVEGRLQNVYDEFYKTDANWIISSRGVKNCLVFGFDEEIVLCYTPSSYLNKKHSWVYSGLTNIDSCWWHIPDYY